MLGVESAQDNHHNHQNDKAQISIDSQSRPTKKIVLYRCHGIAVQENNHDTSRRQKQFHTIRSQNTLQIILVILVELAKSVDCDFSCTQLAFKNFSQL